MPFFPSLALSEENIKNVSFSTMWERDDGVIFSPIKLKRGKSPGMAVKCGVYPELGQPDSQEQVEGEALAVGA